ncbi:hypothetical protein [Geoglobus acetivorans]
MCALPVIGTSPVEIMGWGTLKRSVDMKCGNAGDRYILLAVSVND